MLGLTTTGGFAIAAVDSPGSRQLAPDTRLPYDIILDQGGNFPEVMKTELGPTLGIKYTSIPFNIDIPLAADSPQFIPGIAAIIFIPTWVQVLGWALASKESGSIVVDIWRVPLATLIAGGTPSVANSITGGVNRPTLSAAGAAKSTNISSWQTLLNQSDVVFLNVVSCTNIDTCEFILFAQRAKLQ
jgi:hypothetical protein